MKELMLKTQNSKGYRRLLALLCLLTAVYPLFISLVDMERSNGYLWILQLVTGAAFVLTLLGIGKKPSAEAKVLGAYLLWSLATRLLVGGIGDSFRGSILCFAGCLCLFCIFEILPEADRECFFNLVVGMICGLLFFWAACGLLIVLLGSGYLPVVHGNIRLMDEVQNGHHIRFLVFYNLHRNETAPWFMAAMWMMVYQWFACRKKLWRIPITLAAVLFYITIALQHSRTVYLATAGGIGLLVLLLLASKASGAGRIRRWCAAALVALVCIGVSYQGFTVCNTLISNTAKVTSRIYFQIRGYDFEDSTAQEGESLTDDRSLMKDMKTVTGRKSVWRGIYRTRKADPKLALLGQPENEILPLLMEKGGLKYTAGHMHNMFMQALAETGIPGLLLYLAFAVLLTIRIVKTFFNTAAPMAWRCMTIPLASMLVYGMAEPVISHKSWFASVCFAMMAGLFTARVTSEVKENIFTKA